MPLNGGILRFFERNGPVFEKVYGSLDNVDVRNKFTDYQSALDKNQETFNKIQKFNKIKNDASAYQFDDNDINTLFGKTDKLTIPIDHPDIQGSDSWKNFISTTDRPTDFTEYLKQGDQTTYNDFLTKGYITQEEKKPTRQEIDSHVLGKLNLNPEDKQLYDEMLQNPFDYDGYNRDLQQFALSNFPRLQSTGTLGNTLADTFLRQVSNQQLEKPAIVKPGYELKQDTVTGDWLYFKKDDPYAPPIVSRPGTKDKKEVPPTADQLLSMSFDDVLKKDKDFIDKNFDFFSPETQTALVQKYDYLASYMKQRNLKDNPRVPGRSGPRGPKKPPPPGAIDMSKNLGTYSQLKEKMNADGETNPYNQYTQTALFNEYEKNKADLQRLQVQLSKYGNVDDLASRYMKGDNIENIYEDAAAYPEQFDTAFNEIVKGRNNDGIDAIIHDMYNTETDPAKGGNVQALYDLDAAAWEWLGQIYNSYDPKVIEKAYNYYKEQSDKAFLSKGIKR